MNMSETLELPALRRVHSSVKLGVRSKLSDVILTPEPIAKEIVDYFKPSGVCLDPCRGAGAFWKQMPGAEWCEINEGRDFFKWTQPVDWIITNPPFSILDEWLEHSYAIAKNFVYLLPLPKLFNSARRMQRISELGAMREVLVVAAGRKLGFPFGYACGAIHFETGYRGACKMTPMRREMNRWLPDGLPPDTDCNGHIAAKSPEGTAAAPPVGGVHPSANAKSSHLHVS